MGSIIDAIQSKLGGSNGEYHGITYNFTSDNTFEQILQTPKLWGHDPSNNNYWIHDECSNCEKDLDFDLPYCDNGQTCNSSGGICGSLDMLLTSRPVCQVAGDYFVNEIYKTIIQADSVVDITTLGDFPSGHFLAMLRNAINHLAATKQFVVIRILAGNVTFDRLDTKEFISEITKYVPTSSNIQIFVSTMQTSIDSWNHAKIIAVDGKTAIVGGHNMWAQDYLGFAPVHDVSIKISGSAALDAHHFANKLWEHACYWNKNKSVYGSVHAIYAYHWSNGVTPYDSSDGLPRIEVNPAPPKTGTSQILALGSLGLGIDSISKGSANSNASNTALVEAVRQAQSTLKISQQDLLTYMPPHSLINLEDDRDFMTELAKAILRKVDVYIVLSDPDAKSGAGTSYNNGVAIGETAARIKYYVMLQPNSPRGKDLENLLCSKLHIAPIHFFNQVGNLGKWQFGDKSDAIANHAKIYIVDDKAFYVGSHNIYPANLQEYGYLIEGVAETQKILQEYWNPLWNYSSQWAISGSEAKQCVFTASP
jgi:phosphatidylserine/phosphatidylglycerophosphate/cardiolipin synthase-like enzyme